MTYQHIQGAEDLQRRLRELAPKLERNILRGGLRAGAKVFVQIAQQEVPKRTGKLAKTIRDKTKTRRGLVMAQAVAGDADAWYAHIVRKGAKPHVIRPRRNQRGLFFNGIWVRRIHHPGTKPNPFMERTLERGAPRALAAVADYIRKRLDKLDRQSE